MDDARYVTATEAAQRLGISLRTVRRRIADGTLPSIKVGGAVRIPLSALGPPPRTAVGGHLIGESVASYLTAREDRDAYVRRWNREHWPDTFERMLERRRAAFAELRRLRALVKPPSGPHDTVDTMLRDEREAFGTRLLPYLPGPKAPGS